VSSDQSKLIRAARDLLKKGGCARPNSGRHRVRALLARQALESALDELWLRRAKGLELCSAKAQLLCMPAYLGDPEVAGRVSYSWAGLSRACHQHPYELPPTSIELLDWIGTVDTLVERVRSLCVDESAPRQVFIAIRQRTKAPICTRSLVVQDTFVQHIGRRIETPAR
jgi:hypothetical protein